MKILRTIKDIDGYHVTIVEHDDIHTWGKDLALYFEAHLYKNNMVQKRTFYLPYADALFAPKTDKPVAAYIEDTVREIISEDLLTDPNKREFVFLNGEFKGVIEN